MAHTRQKPEARQEEILAAAIRVAKRDGLAKLRRETVAIEAGVSTGLVNRYFNTMPQLRRGVVRTAIYGKPPVLEIVADAIACRDPEAMKAPTQVKVDALNLTLQTK